MWLKVLELQQKKLFCKVLPKTSKKLFSVLATFVSLIEASKGNDVILDWVLCIYYPIWFKKDEVQALINSNNKVNTMTPAYTSKLSLRVCQTDVGA